ncbi:MAG: HAD family hydrolase [Myxococcales bacterium]|nr:HAD family phosphatase [Myxococcota bacterium]MDW8281932.1 HAD family hydrolase [Myxococcales bacterium]
MRYNLAMQQGPFCRSAAFYDVDGTLIRTNIVHAFAYYARNQPTLLGSLWKTAQTALSVPMFLVADKLSRKLFNQLFYAYYAGQSEDRLIVLAEDLFEEVIRPSIFPGARDLIAESRRAGCRPVLVSGGLDFTLRPLARYLGIEDIIANRLEFDRGYATGQLGRPFVAGATKAQILRDFALQHDIDLAQSWAYSDSYSDYPMLAAVGRPTAVNPDLRLRAVARSYNWPIIDLR